VLNNAVVKKYLLRASPLVHCHFNTVLCRLRYFKAALRRNNSHSIGISTTEQSENFIVTRDDQAVFLDLARELNMTNLWIVAVFHIKDVYVKTLRVM